MSGLQPADVGGTPTASVLLVMLPTLDRRDETSPQLISPGSLAALQCRLGPAVQILQIDEATYPAVVRSFAPAQLPTCVLMHQGVELWRQPGLPDADEVGALLRTNGHGKG